MSFLAFLVATVGWGLLAVVAHELAHAVAAILLGREIHTIDWRRLHVEYWLPKQGADWRDYVIGAAPQLVAASVALAALVGPLALSVPQWLSVGVCAFYGGLEDLRVTTVDATGR